jgi:hypothetical protein
MLQWGLLPLMALAPRHQPRVLHCPLDWVKLQQLGLGLQQQLMQQAARLAVVACTRSSCTAGSALLGPGPMSEPIDQMPAKLVVLLLLPALLQHRGQGPCAHRPALPGCPGVSGGQVS